MTRIEVLSNLSLALGRLTGFLVVLSTVTLLVALLPTLFDYWPVMAMVLTNSIAMAMAIVHLANVGWCFRLAWRGTTSGLKSGVSFQSASGSKRPAASFERSNRIRRGIPMV